MHNNNTNDNDDLLIKIWFLCEYNWLWIVYWPVDMYTDATMTHQLQSNSTKFVNFAI